MTSPPTSQRMPLGSVVSGFPEAGGSSVAPPHRRWRHAVLFTAAVLVPISREWDLGGRQVNFGAVDPLVAMVGLWLVWRLLTKGIRLPLGGLFLLNVAVVGVSMLYNQEIALNFLGPLGILVWLAKTPFLWLSFYLVANLVDDRRDFLVFLRGWLCASVVVASTGMYGSLSFQLTGVPNMFANFYRAQGTLNDTNAYAMYLALSFFLSCVYSRLTPGRRPWVLMVMAIQLAGFSFSGSRGGSLAFVAALLVWWFLSTSIKGKVISAVAVTALFFTLVSLPQWDDFSATNPILERLTRTTLDFGSRELSDRRLPWDEAIGDFLDSPALGIGRGNLGQHSPTGPAFGYGVAHNTLLGLLGEVGLLGTLIYTCVVGVYLWTLLREHSLFSSGVRWGTAAIFLAAFTEAAIASMTINVENDRTLWTLLGLLECYRSLYIERGWRPLSTDPWMSPSPRGAEAHSFTV